MRGRNHDRKLAVSVLVASVSSNADNHTVIVLIYLVNTNTNIFYLVFPTSSSANQLQPKRESEHGEEGLPSDNRRHQLGIATQLAG